jgi:hypothetical protein
VKITCLEHKNADREEVETRTCLNKITKTYNHNCTSLKFPLKIQSVKLGTCLQP